MNHEQIKNRVRKLTLESLHGELNAGQLEELSGLLADSSEARAEYWQAIAIHSALEWELGGVDELGSTLKHGGPQLPATLGEPAVVNPPITAPPWLGMVAAFCALAFVLAGAFWWWSSSTHPLATEAKSTLATPSLVGTIAAMTPASAWSLGSLGGQDAESIHDGDTVWLESGAIEIHLAGNSRAVLESPAIMQFVHSRRFRVIQGAVKIEVAEGADKLAVETVSAELIDLGTIFSVDVHNGKTNVVVFDGEIDLKLNGAAGGVGSNASPPSHVAKRIRAGEAVQVAEDGTLSRVVQVRQAVSDGRAGDDKEPLIVSVNDNIQRGDFWSFYEIVPCGFVEDTPAFVDRPHQWNGVETSGMPSYLVGADFVKTFNDDKVSSDLNITVTLARPATLFVLMDTRLSPPRWLQDSFEETGDQLGVDEVPYTSAEPFSVQAGRLGAGAGVSVDRLHSVWKRVIPDGGEVVLGSNGELGRTVEAGELARANMYGIVAVPLGRDDEKLSPPAH